MAIEEKYVEKVGENKQDVMLKAMDEFGVDAHYTPVSDNGIDLIDYEVMTPSDLTVGEKYIGKPQLTDVISEEDKYTGELKHRVELVLIDNDAGEAYLCKVNINPKYLQDDGVTCKDVHPQSGVYKLVMALMELQAPGISQYYNTLDVVNLKNVQRKVATFENMIIKIIEDSFTDEETDKKKSYNTFMIVGGELAEQ